ncbi:hypothetical protein GCM10009742_66370 [Kribbella karoonensis]|uniref:Secreted protein n=1 Tax=Kribbella karoonensis TaxID=324851 RepID=A0ABP4QE43_9ACTN
MVTVASGYAFAYFSTACCVPASPYWWYHCCKAGFDPPFVEGRPLLEPHPATAIADRPAPIPSNRRRVIPLMCRLRSAQSHSLRTEDDLTTGTADAGAISRVCCAACIHLVTRERLPRLAWFRALIPS